MRRVRGEKHLRAAASRSGIRFAGIARFALGFVLLIDQGCRSRNSAAHAYRFSGVDRGNFSMPRRGLAPRADAHRVSNLANAIRAGDSQQHWRMDTPGLGSAVCG